MNSWKEHLAFSSAFEIAFIGVMFFWQGWYHTTGLLNTSILIFQILVISVISPLIMDVDHKMGKFREVFTFLGLSISMLGVAGYLFHIDINILMVYGTILASMAYMLSYTTHHRGYTHTITFCVFYGFLTHFILGRIDLGVLALIGCYTHLIADKIPLRIGTFQKGIA